MTAARNILIVLLLAAGLAFLPGGGAVAAAIMTAITLAFLAAIAWTVYLAGQSRRYLIDSLEDGPRALLYGGLGLIVLMVAGAGDMLGTGLGALAWILLLAAGIVIVWRVWAAAREI